MISILELMEKKTPLTKRTDRKRGMTLVEIMAAMAILSILFVAISGLMINTAKIENKSDKLLEANTYLKSALLLFEAKDDTGYVVDVNSYSAKKTIYFNTIDNMQEQITSEEDDSKLATGLYNISIIASQKVEVAGNYTTYEVTATMNGVSKSIYVTRG